MAFQPSTFGLPGGNTTAGMSDQEAKMVRIMQAGMESCAVKSIMAGGAGFALGGMFGLFMSSMSYDTPLSQHPSMSQLTTRQQLRAGLKDMGSRSLSSAKNFGKIGALFSICECSIEGLRAKNDLWNSAFGGGMAGGILARNAGPSAILLGAGGFAAFSTAIDWYMRMPESD